jgi:hypothetical protein
MIIRAMFFADDRAVGEISIRATAAMRMALTLAR